MSKKILMAHGAGGKLSAELLREIILPAFDNEILNEPVVRVEKKKNYRQEMLS